MYIVWVSWYANPNPKYTYGTFYSVRWLPRPNFAFLLGLGSSSSWSSSSSRPTTIISISHGSQYESYDYSRSVAWSPLASFSSNVKLRPTPKSVNGSKVILRLPRVLAASGLDSSVYGLVLAASFMGLPERELSLWLSLLSSYYTMADTWKFTKDIILLNLVL